MQRAGELTREVMGRVRDGEISVAPLDRELCKYCDFEMACRVRTQGALVQVAT